MTENVPPQGVAEAGGSSTEAVKRIGVLGGTFDPIHIGHLIAAEEAAAAFGLDRVVFAPARVPPHKMGAAMSPAEDRLAMLVLAIADNPRFAVSRVDLDRDGPHFTVDMLALVRAELDMADGDELLFVVGADSLTDLPTWHEPLRIARRARLVVAARPGYEPNSAALEAELPGISEFVDLLPVPLIGVSATDIRRRVGAGCPIRYQVPDAVLQYISDHGLYGAERERLSSRGT
jgi:nicotinate-nucleotide adenylyltransferase